MQLASNHHDGNDPSTPHFDLAWKRVDGDAADAAYLMAVAAGTLATSDNGWRARVVDHSLGDAAHRVLDDGRALISAASRLIMRSDGTDFTMHNVAAEAGVSRRVLYRLFGGRDELVVALLEEAHIVFARLIGEHADRFDDPIDRLGAALYFASDPRQLTDRSYNAAMTRVGVDTSLRAPDALGKAYRPVFEALTALAGEALDAGRIRPGDRRAYGRMLALSLAAYQRTMFMLAERAVSPKRQDEFLCFCVAGLGAEVPPGWVQRLHLSDEQAALSRARTYELSGGIRDVPMPASPHDMRIEKNVSLIDENETSS